MIHWQSVLQNKHYSSQNIIDDAVRNITSNWNNPNLIFRSLGRHMNRDPQLLPKTRFPLTLFPMETSLGKKFILGELDALIILNMNVVLQKMKEIGLHISRKDDGNNVINLPSGAEFSIVDGWEKILLELITVPSFIKYIQFSTQKVDTEIPNQ